MQTGSLAIVVAVFLAAGAVKGVSGMGLPTLSMALLSLFMPPAAAAALMVVPSLATNLAQCLGPHWRWLARRLWPMWIGLALLTVFSPLPGIDAPGGHAGAILGGVLAAYGAWGLLRPTLPDLRNHALAAGGIAGSLTGLLTAATGVFVIPLVPFLQTLRLGKEQFIQALGLSFTVATAALAARLGHANAGDWASNLPGCAAATLAAFAGLGIGGALRRRMDPALFQRTLYGAFLLLGLVMVARSA